MSSISQQVVNRAWSFAHVLRDDGLSYMAYTEQITFLLFLKIADEIASKNYKSTPLVPKKWAWQALLSQPDSNLVAHYDATLDALSKKRGMLGAIFRKPRPELENPSLLRKLMVDLIGTVEWSELDADVKGDIYEGILAKSAAESPKGAGQYFTPRVLIDAIIECIHPTPEDTVCDPAAGTGGFLLAAHRFAGANGGTKLKKAQRDHLRTGFVKGWELVPNTARLCIMNLYLHGIDADPCPIHSADALANDPEDKFSVVVTNPPFGKKSSFSFVNGGEHADKNDTIYERAGFWVTTKNKQLNFVQHVKSLLSENGRCAIVVPDNVLFEGGAGEAIRRKLLQECDVHTLLRLPTGIFYAQGVKASVLFFDEKPKQEKPWTDKLWVYDLRTNKHFTLKENPLKRSVLDDFVKCYRAPDRKYRRETWSVSNPDGRWRSYTYDELAKRDKLDLNITWLEDESFEGTATLLAPEVIAEEIADDLTTALEQIRAITAALKE